MTESSEVASAADVPVVSEEMRPAALDGANFPWNYCGVPITDDEALEALLELDATTPRYGQRAPLIWVYPQERPVDGLRPMGVARFSETLGPYFEVRRLDANAAARVAQRPQLLSPEDLAALERHNAKQQRTPDNH